MSDLVKEIEQVLAHHDPVCLIKMGAPVDEYQQEAVLIFQQINSLMSVGQIQDIAYQVFVSQFGCNNREQPQQLDRLIGDFSSYKKIAIDIQKVILHE
jgi:hypothetical protein